MAKVLDKVKRIKLKNVLGVFIFVLLIIPSLLKRAMLKIHKKQLWLISENGYMARDNGYIFYKYMKENHPEIETYFAIDKNNADYNKVSKYGNIVNWESIKHYYLYMSATMNISSHKSGEPNHPLFSILHTRFNLYNNFVFLQHGVLYQDFPMFYKKNSKFKIFICGAKAEYDFVNEKYGYDDEVKYTGLARFDNLHNFTPDEKIITFIPTWRRWLDTREKFESSEYYKRIMSFINNEKLEEILEKNDKYLYFYPHLASQKYIDLYSTKNKRVKILNAKDVDIQDLFKTASLMITDFSSVFTDFAYMKKPLIYYQYDKEDFILKHIGSDLDASYFDFEEDGFGEVINEETSLIKTIESYIKSEYKVKSKYLKRINNFFVLNDDKNCERIYNEIMECVN